LEISLELGGFLFFFFLVKTWGESLNVIHFAPYPNNNMAGTLATLNAAASAFGTVGHAMPALPAVNAPVAPVLAALPLPTLDLRVESFTDAEINSATFGQEVAFRLAAEEEARGITDCTAHHCWYRSPSSSMTKISITQTSTQTTSFSATTKQSSTGFRAFNMIGLEHQQAKQTIVGLSSATNTTTTVGESGKHFVRCCARCSKSEELTVAYK